MNVIRTEAQLINSTPSWMNSKLNMKSLLVECSWQTQYGNTWKYPTIVVSKPMLSQNQKLGTPSLCANALLYSFNNNVMLSFPWHHYITAHITMQISGDIMFLWQETPVHAFKHVSSNPSLRACPLVWPHSNHFYEIRDSYPGCTLWHVYISIKGCNVKHVLVLIWFDAHT